MLNKLSRSFKNGLAINRIRVCLTSLSFLGLISVFPSHRAESMSHDFQSTGAAAFPFTGGRKNSFVIPNIGYIMEMAILAHQ